jgi:succinate dehydrogenase / fumarate reductase flavoprotein subunit
VHGANRLGGNSLLDLIVFGRSAGLHVGESLIQDLPLLNITQDDLDVALSRLNRWEQSKQGESLVEIRHAMQKIMQTDFGVFRTAKYMEEGLVKLKRLQERLNHAVLTDHSQIFNTARVEALELDNLMEVATASALSALTREESRGAHSREDFPKRDDENWLKHLLYFSKADTIDFRSVNRKPLTVPPMELKERSY